MKHKDYVRLSKISLKSRKKTTRSTVRGISFGLILLMPLLFIVIAFHIDLNKEVNKDASIRVFNINFSSQMTPESYVSSIHESYQDKVYSIEGVENIIKYNQYVFTNKLNVWDEQTGKEIAMPRFSVMIDGNTFSLDKDVEIPTDYEYTQEGKVGVFVIDTSITNEIFIKADSEAISNNSPIVYGNSFSKNSSKEIIVSSNFLTKYNLDQSIVGKKITLNYQLAYANDVTTSKTSITGDFSTYYNIPVTIFKEYTIVGIYDSNIYKSAPRINTALRYSSDTPYDTYFWLTTDSVYTTTEKSYIPEIVSIEQGENNFTRSAFYYSSDVITLAKGAATDERLFIPCGFGASLNSSNNIIPTSNAIIEFSSYSDANNSVNIINDLLKKSSTSTDDISASQNYMNSTFENYRMFYNVFTYICIVLAIFGGIVFFATLLNLYNTIHYSVQSRRNYLGLSRAIGMKSKEVTKLYFVEVFQIFKRSYIWSAIFGGGICIGICFLFKMIMESDAASIITIDLSLNPIFILVAFFALIVVNTIISIVFSLIACHNVANKPILDVLVENR